MNEGFPCEEVGGQTTKLWSVWKHSGFQNQGWKHYETNEDEAYVRHIHRYLKAVMKNGILHLRYGDDVVDELYIPRGSNKSKEAKSASEVDETSHNERPRLKDTFWGQNYFSELAAINPIIRPIFAEYKTGSLTYTQFLETAVIKLADVDQLKSYLEYIASDPMDQIALSQTSTFKAASHEFAQLLANSRANIESAYTAIHLLNANPVYVAFLGSTLEQLRTLEKLEFDMQPVIVKLAKAMREQEKNSKGPKRKQKRNENVLFGPKRPRGRPRKQRPTEDG